MGADVEEIRSELKRAYRLKQIMRALPKSDCSQRLLERYGRLLEGVRGELRGRELVQYEHLKLLLAGVEKDE